MLKLQAVRSEVSIAVDDVLTVYDITPPLGCPASEITKENQVVVYIIPTLSYVRSILNKVVPGSQTNHLLELQWATASDRIMDGDRQ